MSMMEVNVSHKLICKSIILDLDKVSLALDLLEDIDDHALIQEVLTYLSTCTARSIRSDVFESIRVGKAAQRETL